MRKTDFKHTLLLMISVLLPSLFCSCSKDDDNSDSNNTETEKIDDIAYLEGCLVDVNQNGTLNQRYYGVPLTSLSADTCEVYVGVKNLAEAKEMFKSWIPDQSSTHIAENGDVVILNAVDSLGKAEGKVTFSPVSGNVVIANVTFSDGAKVKYVNKLNFILSSNWPENDSWRSPYSVYNYAESYIEGHVEGSGTYTMVCIREASPSVKGLLLAIDNTCYDEYFNTWTTGNAKSYVSYMPRLQQAKEVSKILRQDWDGFKEVFDNIGVQTLDNKKNIYWANCDTGWSFGIRVINLNTGWAQTWWDFKNGGVKYYPIYVKTFNAISNK